MQSTHGSIAGGAVAALAVMLMAHGAEPVKINVKTGLWEVAFQNQVTGTPEVPPEQAAQMSPEQRARVEAVIQATMANASKPRVGKNCLTPEKLASGMDLSQNPRSSCQQKVTKNTSSEIEITETCVASEGQSVTNEHIVANGSDQVTGTINRVMTATGGKTWTVNGTIQGKWLGPDCGAIKDFEPEKR